MAERDIFRQPKAPFAPVNDSWFSRVEPGAIGSLLVLVALIGGLGYGGFTVLKEIQRVQLAPVDQTPVVLSELDPLEGATVAAQTADDPVRSASGFVPQVESLDRLYRPPALDVPVLVSRDAPISTLDPTTFGSFAQTTAPDPGPSVEVIDTLPLVAEQAPAPSVPQVVAAPAPELMMVAVRPAWVRVQAADGTVIFEGIMDGGDTWEVPATEDPPVLRVGESGAVYFAVDGQTYGPAGPRGTITSDLALSPQTLTQTYALADPGNDGDLARMVAELDILYAPAQ